MAYLWEGGLGGSANPQPGAVAPQRPPMTRAMNLPPGLPASAGVFPPTPLIRPGSGPASSGGGGGPVPGPAAFPVGTGAPQVPQAPQAPQAPVPGPASQAPQEPLPPTAMELAEKAVQALAGEGEKAAEETKLTNAVVNENSTGKELAAQLRKMGKSAVVRKMVEDPQKYLDRIAGPTREKFERLEDELEQVSSGAFANWKTLTPQQKSAFFLETGLKMMAAGGQKGAASRGALSIFGAAASSSMEAWREREKERIRVSMTATRADLADKRRQAMEVYKGDVTSANTQFRQEAQDRRSAQSNLTSLESQKSRNQAALRRQVMSDEAADKRNRDTVGGRLLGRLLDAQKSPPRSPAGRRKEAEAIAKEALTTFEAMTELDLRKLEDQDPDAAAMARAYRDASPLDKARMKAGGFAELLEREMLQGSTE